MIVKLKSATVKTLCPTMFLSLLTLAERILFNRMYVNEPCPPPPEVLMKAKPDLALPDLALPDTPYWPSGHFHPPHPRRRPADLLWLVKNGFLSEDEQCFVQVPHGSSGAYYTLRSVDHIVGFYEGLSFEDGAFVGTSPDSVMKHFYKDQKRSAGWCSIRLVNHNDMPLCQFRDIHMT